MPLQSFYTFLSFIFISLSKEAVMKIIKRRYIMPQKVYFQLAILVMLFELITIINNILEGMSQQTHFLAYRDKARQKQSQGKYEEAIRIYKRALQSEYKEGVDDWQSYISVKNSLAMLLQKSHKYQQSLDTFTEIRQLLQDDQKQKRFSSKKDIAKQKHSCYHNFALLNVQLAQNSHPWDKYQQYRNYMNQSYVFFAKAQAEILPLLLSSLQNTQDFMISWWAQQYLKLKSNVMKLLFNQAYNFDDSRIFERILKQTQKVQRFVKMQSNKQGEVHLFRCYFYKSISLRQLHRQDECFQLLKKDLQYEQNHGFYDDAAKTKNQLFTSCLVLNKLKQAPIYAITQHQKDLLAQVIKNRNTLKKHFSKSALQLRVCSLQVYQQLLFFLDEQDNPSKDLFDYAQVDKYLTINIDLYKENPKLSGYLYYVLAQCNFHLKKYQKANEMIQKSLQIVINDPYQKRDRVIQHFMIRCHLQNDLSKLQKYYGSILKEIQNQLQKSKQSETDWLIISKQHLTTIYNKHKIMHRRKQEQILYDLTTKQQKKFLEKIQKQVKMSSQSKNIQSSDKSQSSLAPSGLDKMKQNLKSLKINPQQQYANRCKQENIQERQIIKDMIVQNKIFNPFRQFFNLSAKQVQILIFYLRVNEIDLQNHFINDVILQTILNKNDINLIQTFKLNGTNHLSHQLIVKVLSCMQLKHLCFTNFQVNKPFDLNSQNQNKQVYLNDFLIPKSIVDVLGLLPKVATFFNPAFLRILQLKYCNLVDQHIIQMALNAYPNIQQVNFANNCLKGTTLGYIFQLPAINKIDISDNSLLEISFDSWKHRCLDYSFVLNRFKINGNSLQNQLIRQQMCFLIEKIVYLDVSNCSSLAQLVSQLWGLCLQGKVMLRQLKTLILKDNDLESIDIRKLLSVLKYAAYLKEIDFRGCKHTSITVQTIRFFSSENPHIQISINSQPQQLYCSSIFLLSC